MPYVLKDIEADRLADEEMQEKLETAGRRGGSIPVIDVQGQILVGFSEGAPGERAQEGRPRRRALAERESSAMRVEAGAAAAAVVGVVACALRVFAPGRRRRVPDGSRGEERSTERGVGPLRPPVGANPHPAAGYTGSAACAGCHRDIYERWRKTPMANVVRDPKIDRDAIIPDLRTNTVSPFALEDVALVYGSVHKQRYFTKRGDDHSAEPAQWDVTHKAWKPYFVEANTDWWAPLYPPDNMQRPTGPLCDGCHSVGYDVETKEVVEWNVGCERCHGPGAEHAAKPIAANIVDPKRLDDRRANDTCIQCHAQGRTARAAVAGRAYDWPVGYRVGLDLRDVWRLEDHTLGETTFTHFADGTAHKNRMQGNDFVQSVMYRRGVTCFSCHDIHGTANAGPAPALRSSEMCGSVPRAWRAERPAREDARGAHAPTAPTSAGSACVACHMPKIETTIAGT